MSTKQPSNSEIVLRCTELHRYLGQGEGRVHVLKGVSFEANRGQVYAIVGPSGQPPEVELEADVHQSSGAVAFQLESRLLRLANGPPRRAREALAPYALEAAVEVQDVDDLRRGFHPAGANLRPRFRCAVMRSHPDPRRRFPEEVAPRCGGVTRPDAAWRNKPPRSPVGGR